jgi:hypothetical protein
MVSEERLPKYMKLISYIERYDLGRYDTIVMGEELHFEKQDTESLTVRIDL